MTPVVVKPAENKTQPAAVQPSKPAGDSQPIGKPLKPVIPANKTDNTTAVTKANTTAPLNTTAKANKTTGDASFNQVKPGQFDWNKTPDSFNHTSPETVEDQHTLEPAIQPILPKPTPAANITKPVPVPQPVPAKPVTPQPVKPVVQPV